ncbi:hypothetical protein [Rhodococcus rhodnii]|uniref:hypothetical protein n=1 Tax=Rhodococcus rhodnii TaxID=38312 RepID=UPI000686FF1F|nr:hypothetical protein [Rhodococcus rhodnii]
MRAEIPRAVVFTPPAAFLTLTPLVPLLPEQERPVVVDAGAGTGIALEALLPLLPDAPGFTLWTSRPT